jgi:hypothetical protein
MILYSLVPIKRINAFDGHTVGPKSNEVKYFVPLVAIGSSYRRDRTLSSAMKASAALLSNHSRLRTMFNCRGRGSARGKKFARGSSAVTHGAQLFDVGLGRQRVTKGPVGPW